MIYLFLSILSSVGVAVVIHYNENRHINRFGAMLFNYIAAALLGLLFYGKLPTDQFSPFLIVLGCTTGFIFVSAFLVYMHSVKNMGLAIPVTITRLSVVIPVLGSIFIFSESISFYQVGGLLLAILSILLFSGNHHQKPETGKVKPATLLLPLLLFSLMGFGDFSLKIFQENFDASLILPYTTLVFFVSTLYSLVLVLYHKVNISGMVILSGALLGIPNFFSAYFILKLLQVFPGAIAFPLNNIGIIVLSSIIGVLVWNEKLHKKTLLAIGIAMIAVVLLNL